MKKTIALIYRLILIIISVWALWAYTGFSAVSCFSDTAVFSSVLNFLAVAAAFVAGIKSFKTASSVIRFKFVCVMLAAAVLFINRLSVLGNVSLWWIVNVLLPLLAVIDWLLFDPKGFIRFNDILLGLLAMLGVLAILGVKTADALSALLPALVLGTVILLADRLFLGKKSRSGLFPLIYRLIFLLLECYGFYLVSGRSVESFVNNLKYYTVLVNLFCFAVIMIVVITGILDLKKGYTYIARIKGCFTVLLVIAAVLYFSFIHSGEFEAYHIIHSIVCPVMMVLDWILFDTKGVFKWYDGLWWASPVLIYAGYIGFVSIPVYGDYIYNTPQLPCFVFAGLAAVAIVVGYIIFAADKLFEKIGN